MNMWYEETVTGLIGEFKSSYRMNDNEVNTNILKAVIENMSEEFIIFDNSSRFIMINKSVWDNPVYDNSKMNDYHEFCEQVKYYDLMGKVLSFDDIPSQRVLRGEKFSDLRLKIVNEARNLSSYREYSGTPIYDDSKNIIGGLIITRDAEEKMKLEESTYIRAHINSLSEIIENLDLGLARYTYPDFNFIDINNKGYAQLKGIFPEIFSQEDLKNKNLYDIFDGKVQIIDNAINETLRDKKSSCFRISKYIANNEAEYVKWIYQPLLNLKGEITEVIIIGISITREMNERNKMEEVLKIQDEIYSNVSHELKTPLNVIFSANQMMDIYLNSSSLEDNRIKLHEYNNNIKQNCYRLIKLINNIVDLSKSNSGLLNVESVNVNIVGIVETIVKSVSVYVKNKGLEIEFKSNVKEKIIACDVNLIERVMLNLISNAVKFSKPNGKITISVLDKGETVEISVKDHGTGIKKKHLDFIFQRFYQADKSLSRNTEGSGIGLSLVKSIIDLHEGTIRVESAVGKGSKFIVELPAKKADEIIDASELVDANHMNSKIEMLKIEFSDIYSIS